MAKFCGKIGFAIEVEERPGVYLPRIIEKTYFGDIIRNSRRKESSSSVNFSLNIENQISVIADPFANENFQFIKYVEYPKGTKWNVSSVEIEYPRILLNTGGLYNDQESD